MVKFLHVQAATNGMLAAASCKVRMSRNDAKQVQNLVCGLNLAGHCSVTAGAWWPLLACVCEGGAARGAV